MAQSGASTLGNLIRAWRRKQNVSQAEAAEAIGISRAHLANIETGRDHPGRATLMAIAAYYRASLDELFSHTRRPMIENEKTAVLPEQLLELAIRFLGQDRSLDPARYARRVALVHKALQEAQRDGQTITAETVPGIVADALEKAPDDPGGSR
jgi:transcriptional regulator with XRE-family HTH domain